MPHTELWKRTVCPFSMFLLNSPFLLNRPTYFIPCCMVFITRLHIYIYIYIYYIYIQYIYISNLAIIGKNIYIILLWIPHSMGYIYIYLFIFFPITCTCLAHDMHIHTYIHTYIHRPTYIRAEWSGQNITLWLSGLVGMVGNDRYCNWEMIHYWREW